MTLKDFEDEFRELAMIFHDHDSTITFKDLYRKKTFNNMNIIKNVKTNITAWFSHVDSTNTYKSKRKQQHNKGF